MAQVVWAPAIQTVSGALNKIDKKSQHAADQKMILATHRKAETTNPNCCRIYIRGVESITRNTPLSAAEMVNRERFGAVTRAVNTRMHDISKISQDQAAFKAQTTYKTMKSYLWAICAQAYDESQG